MRLICPECAAQYEIADGLIPPEGRDVECSACGHGWREPGLPALLLSPEVAVPDDEAAAALPDDDLPPPLASRGLTDPVLAILREEAERELAVRAAERTGRRDALATDIADATRRRPDEISAPAGQAEGLPDPHALAASLQWEVPGRPAEAVVAPQLPALSQLPAPVEPASRPATTGVPPLAVQQRRAHDRGFAAAILVAALLAGAYVAAPSLAGWGAAGARLMQAREAVDRGRIWLQAEAEALTDGLIDRVQAPFD